MANTKLDKLLAKREAMNAEIRRETAKLQSRERAVDTRRKVLVGAAVLGRAESDAAFRAELRTWMDKFLVRGNDRVLFEFSPLPGHPVAPETEPDDPLAGTELPADTKAA